MTPRTPRPERRHTLAARWIARTNPAGLLYGAIVSGAVLATVSANADHATLVGATTGLVLVVYWMAHVYVATMSSQFGDTPRHFVRRLRAAGVHEASVLTGGVPALLVYGAAILAGADIGRAATAGVYFTVLLLAAVGYLGARQAGVRGRLVLLEVIGSAAFGVPIIAAKTLLH